MRWLLLCCCFICGCAPHVVTLPDSPLRVIDWPDTTQMVWVATVDSTSPPPVATVPRQLTPEDFGLIPPPVAASGPWNHLFLMRDGSNFSVIGTYQVVVTGYASRFEQTDSTPHITANGHVVTVGVVACNWLPFGTRVRFPDLFGDMIFTVDDRMNPRYDNSRNVDIWFPSNDAAVRFRLRRAAMEALGPPNGEE